ncbi:MAG: type II toxin-antitoxin system HicB family antitoxin [Vulcanimicrobiota bacterium]
MMKYPAIIHHDPDGIWIEFPDLGGSGTQGDTMEELLMMAEDALNGVLAVRHQENLEIPPASQLSGKDIVYIDVRPEVEIPILFRQWRKEQGLSQGEIAQKIRAPYQTIQKLEKIGCNPTLKTLRKVAKALGKNLLIDVA